MKNICLRLLHLFTIFKFSESSCDDNWPKCGKNRNVVCERGEDCSGKSGCTIMPLDEDFRRWVVDEHNKLKSRVAQGEETRGSNVAAADMMALSYDVELEYTAQCNLNSCKYAHDKCRRTKKLTAGQNIYMASGESVVFNEAKIREAINLWYEEAKDTTDDILTAYSSAGVGHYTQMVWAKTSRIGCARATKGINFYLVCNYGEQGNVLGRPVYTKGTACSKCPDGVACNTKYKGLCGNVDESEFTGSSLKGGRISVSYYVSLGVPLVLISFKFWHVLY